MNRVWRWGRWQLAPEALVLLAVLLLALGIACEGQRTDARQAELAALRRVNDSLRIVTRAVDTLYVHQRDTLRRLVVRMDTVTQAVERWKHDTTEVVRYVTLADSTIRACTATLLTCERRVALRDQRIQTLETALDVSAALANRPWTAAGVAWTPQGVGAFVDRDLGRVRLGASVTAGHVEVRGGWRW